MRWDPSSERHEQPVAAPSTASTLRPMNPTHDDAAVVFPELRRMADELRVRIHLAGLDARDAWAELEIRMQGLEERAAVLGARAKDQLALVRAGLEHELRALADGLPRKGDGRGGVGLSSN